VICEGRLSDETVLDQQRTRFRILPIAGVGFPNVEYFAIGVVFEKMYVGNNVKHGALVHPL